LPVNYRITQSMRRVLEIFRGASSRATGISLVFWSTSARPTATALSAEIPLILFWHYHLSVAQT
jgi:hypothetical protein